MGYLFLNRLAGKLPVLLADEVELPLAALDRKVWYSGRLAKRTHLLQRYDTRTICWSGNGTRVTSTLRVSPDTGPVADVIHTTTSGDTGTSSGSNSEPGEGSSPLIGC